MIHAQHHRLPSGLCRLDDQQIITRQSPGLRVFAGLFSLFFAAGMVFTLCLWNMPYAPGWPVEVFEVITFGAFSWLLWWTAGPHDLSIDLYRRTYQMTTGFPFFPRVRHGSLDEVAAVCVYKGGGNGSKAQTAQTRFWIKLLWKQPRRGDVYLCRCGSQEAADAVVQQVTDALGLPDGDAALGALWSRNARLRRCDGGGLAFHKSLALRVTMGVLGKALTIGCLVLSGALAFSKGGGPHLQATALNPAWLLLDTLGLLCLRAAGPQDLEVDLNARTYLYRAGFPGLARTVTGGLGDIIALNTASGGDSGGYRVQLIWAQPRRRQVTLGEFYSQQEADAHRSFLAAHLGIGTP